MAAVGAHRSTRMTAVSASASARAKPVRASETRAVPRSPRRPSRWRIPPHRGAAPTSHCPCAPALCASRRRPKNAQRSAPGRNEARTAPLWIGLCPMSPVLCRVRRRARIFPRLRPTLMLKALKNLFGGDSNQRTLKKLWPVVDEINELADTLTGLTDDELRAKTDGFRAAIREATAPIDAELEETRVRLRAAGNEAEDEPAPRATVRHRPARRSLYATARTCMRASTTSKASGSTPPKTCWTTSSPRRSPSSKRPAAALSARAGSRAAARSSGRWSRSTCSGSAGSRCTRARSPR